MEMRTAPSMDDNGNNEGVVQGLGRGWLTVHTNQARDARALVGGKLNMFLMVEWQT